MWQQAHSTVHVCTLSSFPSACSGRAEQHSCPPCSHAGSEVRQSSDSAGLGTHPHHAYRREHSTTSKGASDWFKTWFLREKQVLWLSVPKQQWFSEVWPSALLSFSPPKHVGIPLCSIKTLQDSLVSQAELITRIRNDGQRQAAADFCFYR